MMNALALLLATALFAGDVDVLVLRSGHQILVDGTVSVADGKALFRDPSGVLFSIPLSEIDEQATRARTGAVPADPRSTVTQLPSPTEPERKLRIRVSAAEKERLLKELEKSRGTPAPPVKARPLERVLGEEVEIREKRGDEEYWRAESRRYEESVRRSRDQVELLQKQVQYLEDEVRALLSFGVHPDQYGGNLIRLQDSRWLLGQARLEVGNAERDLADFRESARRQGILPGWLR